MYKQNKIVTTSININASYEGETIEQKMERIVNNQEPITDGAPLIYTERMQGVMAGYDPRTDRFDIAIDAMDAVSKSRVAKRDAKVVEMQAKKDGGAEPIDGTSEV